MDAVSARCRTELGTCFCLPAVTYERCLVSNRGNQMACKDMQRQLSECAASAVPMLRTIKQTCGPLIQAYDRCLETYADAPHDELVAHCTPKLQAVAQCSNAVRADAARGDAK